MAIVKHARIKLSQKEIKLYDLLSNDYHSNKSIDTMNYINLLTPENKRTYNREIKKWRSKNNGQ